MLCEHYGVELFQSTPPAWEATLYCVYCTQSIGVSIHAPRVGGDALRSRPHWSIWFQSTPPAWEATAVINVTLPPLVFQSTPPAWEATKADADWYSEAKVSIHAPRVGGDMALFMDERMIFMFQSTPPAWEATHQFRQWEPANDVSIHAPRVGGDILGSDAPPDMIGFNPRPPRGRRHAFGKPISHAEVSIHAPRVGGDRIHGF